MTTAKPENFQMKLIGMGNPVLISCACGTPIAIIQTIPVKDAHNAVIRINHCPHGRENKVAELALVQRVHEKKTDAGTTRGQCDQEGEKKGDDSV